MPISDRRPQSCPTRTPRLHSMPRRRTRGGFRAACALPLPALTASLALASLLTAAATPALARPDVVESTDEKRSALSVTVYNSDLGLVREVRSVQLPRGTSTLRFGDVAERIRPETVSVSTASGPALRVLEQNYEYDLINASKILDKYVGREVTVYVTNPETGDERPVTATLLSNNNGQIFRIGKQISLGLPGRVVVPDLPDNLIARPTLLWLLETDGRGARDLEVSYLTGGMSWRADYVATLAGDERTLDLTGWVTVDNQSGARFTDATLKLVAGDVNLVRPTTRYRDDVMKSMAMAEPMRRGFQEREFFEYHLYALERPTTLGQNQTKQIELLHADSVAVKKRYIAETAVNVHGGSQRDTTPRKVDVKLEFVNDAESNLGRPLPKGVVRVYKSDTDESLIFAGEDSIDHTPDGETVRLTLGEAFDVTFERRVTSYLEVSKREIELGVEVKIRNRKDEPVTVTVVERFPGQRRILGSSAKAGEPDAFTSEFEIEVPADGARTVTYEARASR